MYSCERSDPGCLDLNAENYDVFAVSECDSCCVYPSGNINLAFEYVFKDSVYVFTFNSEYPYAESDTIEISDFQLPLSQFTFYGGGEAFKVRDTIRGRTPRVYDDFILKEKSSANLKIGTTSFVGDLDSVSFYVGLEEESTLALWPFEDVDQTSKFVSVVDDMFVDSTEQLLQGKIILTIKDSLRELELLDLKNPMISFPITETLKPGLAWFFELNIDLHQVIDGISPDDTNEVMATTISKNISKSFSKR